MRLVRRDSRLESGGELVLSVQETETAISGAGSNAFDKFSEMTKVSDGRINPVRLTHVPPRNPRVSSHDGQ